MNRGILGVIGAALFGALAMFLGEENAHADPGTGPSGGPSAQDKLGAAEAAKLAAILDKALATCHDPDTDPAGCDVGALHQAIDEIHATQWDHPEVAAAAKAQADKLADYAATVDEYQKQGAKEASQAQAIANGALAKCQNPDNCNINALYAAANQLESTPWHYQSVQEYAYTQALNLKSLAKDVEDYRAQKMAAQKEADYPWSG